MVFFASNEKEVNRKTTSELEINKHWNGKAGGGGR